MGYIVTLTASYRVRNQGHIFPYSTTNAQFTLLLPFPYIALGTGYIFSRVFWLLTLLLALATGYMFSLA